MNILYHYTTLPELVKVVTKRQLKFISLLKYIELYEIPNFFPESLNPNIRKYFEDVFVSLWTKDKHESMLRWKCLSNIDNGIIIGIDFDSFGCNGTFESKIEVQNIFCTNIKVKQPDPIVRISESVQIPNVADYLDSIGTLKDEDFFEQENCIELIRNHHEKLENLPLISSVQNYPISQIRLLAKLIIPPRPSNKNGGKDYDRRLLNEGDIASVVVNLPQSFEIADIVVSPNFSDSNNDLLMAFLDNYGVKVNVRESCFRKPYQDLLMCEILKEGVKPARF